MISGCVEWLRRAGVYLMLNEDKVRELIGVFYDRLDCIVDPWERERLKSFINGMEMVLDE